MLARSHDSGRFRLRLLDRCLHELEDAHEADLVTVPDQVVVRVRQLVPAVTPGMPITEAINLVLREQEHYLVGADGVLLPDSWEGAEPLDESGARELTERIKSATREVCMLLYEAHRRRAWLALGYQSWDQYAHGEFALSRTRSYELVDQGRVIRSLQAAAGISGLPDVSAYAAEQIKPFLPEVIETVRERTAGVSEEDGLRIVVEAVRERRRLLATERRTRELAAARQAGVELVRLRTAIESLANMPPVGDVIEQVDGQKDRLSRIDKALEWLAEFAIEWRRRRRSDPPVPASLMAAVGIDPPSRTPD
ncbi:MAG TPA: hypothetical protein VIC57_17775 [Candidatus Dormibacteraeota bacterium]|jgi:hypothetical protein